MNTIRTNPIASTRGLGTAFLLAAALFTALIVGVACGGEEGETPACVQDVSSYYDASADVTVIVHENVNGGCNPLAVCQKAPKDPAQCCQPPEVPADNFESCMKGFTTQ